MLRCRPPAVEHNRSRTSATRDHAPWAPIAELVDSFNDMWPAWRQTLARALSATGEQALDRLTTRLRQLNTDAFRRRDRDPRWRTVDGRTTIGQRNVDSARTKVTAWPGDSRTLRLRRLRVLFAGGSVDLSRAHDRIFRVTSELNSDVAMGSADPRDERAHATIQATLREALVRDPWDGYLRRTPEARRSLMRTTSKPSARRGHVPQPSRPLEDAAQRPSYTWSTAGKEKRRPGQCWAWIDSGWDENRKIEACTNPLNSRFPS